MGLRRIALLLFSPTVRDRVRSGLTVCRQTATAMNSTLAMARAPVPRADAINGRRGWIVLKKSEIDVAEKLAEMPIQTGF